MPVGRGGNFKSIPLKVVGSSVYGLYNKISAEKTYNMTISDGFLVPYPGYKIGIGYDGFNEASTGRALYESVKLNKIVAVFDDNVYLITLNYDHITQTVNSSQVTRIGSIGTSSGVVYISENNKPQILISDGVKLYLYDPTLTKGTYIFTAIDGTPPPGSTAYSLVIPSNITFSVGEPIIFSASPAPPTGITAGTTYYIADIISSDSVQTIIQIAASVEDIQLGNIVQFTDTGNAGQSFSTQGSFQYIPTTFVPGYITFHDTYFIAAASQDQFYVPVANNTWHLSGQNNGFLWPSLAQNVGLLESKPDNTQAVVRFPSKGNMILVMGETVTEFWYDTGAQLFPYQRQNQASIDYGCLNPATVAFMDEIVVWLARNEKSGPVIMFTTGSMPQKITTDGIDFQLSELNTPEDSQGFIYRKNGHLFYHLNFYSDNISFVVDLTTMKIFNACDENINYYEMGQVVWFQNQYFSITKDNGNLFIFDTVFYTYDSVDSNNLVTPTEIPRIRLCQNIRLPSQDYFIANDIGFTIETGETPYQVQYFGDLNVITEAGDYVIVDDEVDRVVTEDGLYVQTEAGDFVITEQYRHEIDFVITEQPNIIQSTPRVDLCVSYDGGASFGADMPYVLNPIGKRRNRLMWWQGGLVNDMVIQIKFWGIGRFIATDGEVNIRQ